MQHALITDIMNILMRTYCVSASQIQNSYLFTPDSHNRSASSHHLKTNFFQSAFQSPSTSYHGNEPWKKFSLYRIWRYIYHLLTYYLLVKFSYFHFLFLLSFIFLIRYELHSRLTIRRHNIAEKVNVDMMITNIFDAIYSVSQKKSSLRTCGNFSKTVWNFSTKFYVPITRSYLRYNTNFYSINCNFDDVVPY